MLIREKSNFKNPREAIGKVTIELTDPVTNKVKERFEVKNHVFEDSLFSGWPSVDDVYLVLCDDGTAVDANLPFLRGNVVGYGAPGAESLGTLRGAYRAANQVLAEQTETKIRWKFQYDFTTAQANGVIRNIGLTSQYQRDARQHISGFLCRATSTKPSTPAHDGRYAYGCSTAGVITKADNIGGGTNTIDVSAVVGTATANKKHVGFSPATGKYYIFVGSSTTASRKMYCFSDNTFTTLEATYSPTNITLNTAYPFYVFGDFMYMVNSVNISKANFAGNVTHTSFSPADNLSLNILTNEGVSASFIAGTGTSISFDKYIVLHAASNGVGSVFDTSTDTFVSYGVMSSLESSTSARIILHPVAKKHTLPCAGENAWYNNCAITSLVLPEPVTKTSANGMTVTYELEVFW